MKNKRRVVSCEEIINEKLGTLEQVLHKKSFLRISQQEFQRLGMGDTNYYHILRDDNYIFVNWSIFSQARNEQGRLPLYSLVEQNVKWSDGLCNVLEDNGAAIYERDERGLEAFMLAAIGEKSNLETVYKLLEFYPVAAVMHC